MPGLLGNPELGEERRRLGLRAATRIEAAILAAGVRAGLCVVSLQHVPVLRPAAGRKWAEDGPRMDLRWARFEVADGLRSVSGFTAAAA